MVDLDEVDRGILHLLQQDARNTTTVEMAEQLSVSDQTVRNRIENLQDDGIVEGYIPVINYERADFPIRLEFTCTAPVKERGEIAEEALGISNIVRVEEMLSARENIRVLAVTNTSDEVNDVTSELDDLGLTIESEQLQKTEHVRPFNHFGDESVSLD